MANTYTWIIQLMACAPSAGGQTDVVITANWIQNATDGKYMASVYGSQSFTYVPGSPFTAYADLTQDQVVGWIQTALGTDQLAALKANLDQQIENQVNPPVVYPPLPWS